MSPNRSAGSPGYEFGRGVYDAHRAAALAGIPLSTLNYWARTGVYTPSVCAEPRTRLWSWGDLLALRAIDSFRRGEGLGKPVPTHRIRAAVAQLEQYGFDREQLADVVRAARSGELFLFTDEEIAVRADASRQGLLPGLIDLIGPYNGGPDLLTPRPLLRILPGKLHGEPHVEGTRIPSAAIYALRNDGYEMPHILSLYPELSPGAVEEAIDLEQALALRAA